MCRIILSAHYAIRYLGENLPVLLLAPIVELFFQFAAKKNVSIVARTVTERGVLTKVDNYTSFTCAITHEG